MFELKGMCHAFFEQYDPHNFSLKVVLKMLLVLCMSCCFCLGLHFQKIVIMWIFFLLNYALFTCFIGHKQDRSHLFILLWTLGFIILALSHLIAPYRLVAMPAFVIMTALGSWHTYQTKYQRLFSELACIIAVSWLYNPVPSSCLSELALAMLFSGSLYFYGILAAQTNDATLSMLQWIKYCFIKLAKNLQALLQQKSPPGIWSQRDLFLAEFQGKINIMTHLQSHALNLELLQQHVTHFDVLVKHAYHLMYQYHKLASEGYSDLAAKTACESVIYLVYGVPYITDQEFNQKVHLLQALTQNILLTYDNHSYSPIPHLRIYEFITLCSAASLNLTTLRQILRAIKNIS